MKVAKDVKIRVENFSSRSGGVVPNQFIVTTRDGKYFQSYDSVIAFISNDGKVMLDADAWDYSMTTGKYRNIFLGEDKRETEKKIKSKEYRLVDLNK